MGINNNNLNGLREEEKEIFLDFILFLQDKTDRNSLKEKIRNFLENKDFQYIEKYFSKINSYEEDIDTSSLKDLFIEVLFDRINDFENQLLTIRNIVAEQTDPIIKLRKGTLMVPIIGILHSERAQNLAENLLNKIKETESLNVIIDVTGITTLDTVVAGFLIETFKAIRLLGATPILCGISPEIAHSLVKVGIDLNMLEIKMDLEEAINEIIKKELTKD